MVASDAGVDDKTPADTAGSLYLDCITSDQYRAGVEYARTVSDGYSRLRLGLQSISRRNPESLILNQFGEQLQVDLCTYLLMILGDCGEEAASSPH